jgi:hypothetical protein
VSNGIFGFLLNDAHTWVRRQQKAKQDVNGERCMFYLARFVLVLLSQERENILHPPTTIQLYLVMGSLAQVAVDLGQCSCCCCTVPQPRPSSLPPFLPPADLLTADPPRAPRCSPNQSASRLIEQVAGTVEFWLCFPVFWH